jgi:hypothetical protein
VEAVWLPDEQIWALQLTEPDLGSHPGALTQDRPPVPGRLFETNVAFRIISGQVECGFRTVVSEPEGTMAPCEVYRLAIIKRLARNAKVGLKQSWPIIDTAHMLERGTDLSHLQEWLKDRDRMMLAVIVAESVSDQPGQSFPATLDELKTNIRRLPPRGFPFASPTELTPTLNPVSLEKIIEGKLRSPAMGLGRRHQMARAIVVLRHSPRLARRRWSPHRSRRPMADRHRSICPSQDGICTDFHPATGADTGFFPHHRSRYRAGRCPPD